MLEDILALWIRFVYLDNVRQRDCHGLNFIVCEREKSEEQWFAGQMVIGKHTAEIVHRRHWGHSLSHCLSVFSMFAMNAASYYEFFSRSSLRVWWQQP